MASPELSASLTYLTNAAHLLRAVAPQTSAHLMSQRASLLYHHDMAVSEAQRQHVCGACGHIMIPGQMGTTITFESRKSGKPRRRHGRAAKPGPPSNNNTPASGPVKVLTCGLCQRATRTRLPAPEKVTRRGLARPLLAQKQQQQQQQQEKQSQRQQQQQPQKQQKHVVEKRQDPITAANASSKKRAKSRKAGLQALLSGQQQRQSNPLSLADFGR